MSKLSSNAILCNLSMRQARFNKLDKGVTDETLAAKGAKAGAARVYKSLVSKAALKPIQQAMNAAKTYHNKVTLPYHNKGARLLPTTLYFEYSEKMSGFKNDVTMAVNKFIEDYEEHVHQARQSLGDMFDKSDFPDISRVQDKFMIDIQMYPVPEASTLGNLAFSSADRAELEKNVQNTLQNKTDDAIKDIYRRVYTAVNNIAVKLKKEDSVFHGSLVGNLEDIVLLLPALNVTDDMKLNSIYEDIKLHLSELDVKELREDMAVRKDTAEEAKKIADSMAAYF